MSDLPITDPRLEHGSEREPRRARRRRGNRTAGYQATGARQCAEIARIGNRPGLSRRPSTLRSRKPVPRSTRIGRRAVRRAGDEAVRTRQRAEITPIGSRPDLSIGDEAIGTRQRAEITPIGSRPDLSLGDEAIGTRQRAEITPIGDRPGLGRRLGALRPRKREPLRARRRRRNRTRRRLGAGVAVEGVALFASRGRCHFMCCCCGWGHEDQTQQRDKGTDDLGVAFHCFYSPRANPGLEDDRSSVPSREKPLNCWGFRCAPRVDALSGCERYWQRRGRQPGFDLCPILSVPVC